MIAFGVAVMPDLVFDSFLGLMYAVTSVEAMLTNPKTLVGFVVVFAAGIAFERYR